MSDVYKIVVLGDGGVGKTCLTIQLCLNHFTYDPTIEDSYRKQVVIDEEPCVLEVLDTAGQEEYTALRDQWIRDGEGFVIVYAVTSYTSFERVERFKEQVTRVKDSDKVPVVIVGNKCDVEDNLREVKADEAQAVAQKNGWKLMEASAKTCYNVEEPFFNVARMIRASQRQEEAPAAVDDTKTKKKGKCLIL